MCTFSSWLTALNEGGFQSGKCFFPARHCAAFVSLNPQILQHLFVRAFSKPVPMDYVSPRAALVRQGEAHLANLNQFQLGSGDGGGERDNFLALVV
ncbi:MAG: hypothetical protein JSR61_00720 [Proteobacteria bacterium]|nr:hypothetical protein [Pseudomonadota bacterium]